MESLLTWLDLTSFVPGDLLVVAVLVVLEGLLSCDNAVVLALLVKDLPPEQRGKALRYGILGAYVFRIVALSLAVYIMTVWWLKVLGGAYLCWLAISFFRKQGHTEHEHGRQVKLILGLNAFWSTVVAVELTDIVFSVDSIAAAVALSNKMWVLILGGLLGILAMRFAAQGFVTLLERFPRLESCAFAAVAVIGLKLLLELPLDVVGRTQPLPPDVRYATAQEYRQAVETHIAPVLHVNHVITVNRVAAPAPDPAAFASPKEFAAAESAWALHHRPWIEIEGWVGSLIVLLVFSFGFVRRKA